MVHYYYQNQILNWHLKKPEPPYAVSKLIWVRSENSKYRGREQYSAWLQARVVTLKATFHYLLI